MRRDYYKKILKDKIIIVDFGKKAEKQLEKLKSHKPKMYNYVMEAKKKLEGDPFLGKGPIDNDIYKHDIRFKKYENLWKYYLPDGWRMMYTIATHTKITILAIIIEFGPHDKYDKLMVFGPTVYYFGNKKMKFYKDL